MNNDRRKRINALITSGEDYAKELIELHGKVEEAISDLNEKLQEAKDDLTSQIEELRDEEQEAFDNMPESLQNGEKGELVQEAVNNLESAINELESLNDVDGVDLPDLAEMVDYLNQATA